MYEITLKLIDWESIVKRFIEGNEEYKGKKLHDTVIQQCKIEQRVNKLDTIPGTYDLCLIFGDADIEMLLDTMEKVDHCYTKSNDVTLLLLHGQITFQITEQDRIHEQFGYSGISEIEEDCKDD